MNDKTKESERFRQAFILILAIAISAVFFSMIRGMLIALLMGAIIAGMTYPIYRRLLRRSRNREALSAILTMLMILLVIIIPLLGLLSIVAAQAIEVSNTVSTKFDDFTRESSTNAALISEPGTDELISEPDRLGELLKKLPYYDEIKAHRGTIIQKVGEFAGEAGKFMAGALTAATKGAVSFFFGLFIMLYAMFFFLVDGPNMLARIRGYLPLPLEDSSRMLEKFVSVTRATLKGTLVIGIIQGVLAGASFAVAGISGAVFWGTIMAVLSIIPGVGTAVVWVPAVIYLFAKGQIVAAIGVTLWCAIVVGMADNALRPKLIGKDAKMSDLMILLGTLGGLALFGAVGIVIGPVIAALFVTIWEIYGSAFKAQLGKA